jgi:predicted Zn-dependent protease
MGQRLVAALGPKNPYKFDYHLLADNQTINAFALPGGQVFITRALYDRLETEAQLAGVLGHETGHVVHRHGAQQMANQQFYQRLAGAAAVGSGDYNTAQIAQYVAQVRELSYSRKDELEADQSGLELMTALGYTPQAQAEVMAILKNASGGRGNGPDWMSTHPNPDARIEVIKEWIARHYPNGIPGTLTEGGRLH